MVGDKLRSERVDLQRLFRASCANIVKKIDFTYDDIGGVGFSASEDTGLT